MGDSYTPFSKTKSSFRSSPKFYRDRIYKRNATIVQKEKSKPCVDCGEKYNYWQMQFDHRDQTKKKYEISWMESYGIKKLMDEIAKCDLVCANCHADRTYKNRHWIRSNSVSREVLDPQLDLL